MDEKSQSGDKSDERPDGDTPLKIPQANHAGPEKPTTEKHLEEIEEKMSAFERSIIRLTTVNIFIVAATGLFIGLQWSEMRSGGIDTHNLAVAAGKQAEAAKVQIGNTTTLAKAAKSSADTAINTLSASIEAFRTDERAWVEIGNIDRDSIPAEAPFGVAFRYGFYPKNLGKTVARDVRISLQEAIGGADLMSSKRGIKMIQDQMFRVSGTNKRSIIPDKPGPQTLAPGEQSPVPVYIGGSEPKRMPAGSFYSYILGRIDYIDAFNSPHWKHLCFFVSNAKGELGHCEYGNDTDRNREPKAN